MLDLKGKVVIITGGANGIGAVTVRSFLREGAKFVAIIDVDETSGIELEQDLKREHGEDAAKFFKCDVTNDVELFDVFNYTVEHHGYIDVVINNAAIANEVIYKKEIDINFKALVISSFKALEIMRKDQGGNGGTIINISSIAALAISKDPGVYVYSATKAAVLMFDAELGTEIYYLHTGVRVITVCFGVTSTDIVKSVKGIDDISTSAVHEALKLCKPQTPQEAADGVVEAFKRGKSGSTWLVLGGEITDITERVLKAYQVMSGEIQI